MSERWRILKPTHQGQHRIALLLFGAERSCRRRSGRQVAYTQTDSPGAALHCPVVVWCREELQEAQWQAAKANLVACRTCHRRFAPDRVGVHERACKAAPLARHINNSSSSTPPHDNISPRDIHDDRRGQWDFVSCNKRPLSNDAPMRCSGTTNSCFDGSGKHFYIGLHKCQCTTG